MSEHAKTTVNQILERLYVTDQTARMFIFEKLKEHFCLHCGIPTPHAECQCENKP